MIADLLTFCFLPPSEAVAHAARELAPTAVTLSAPSQDKWRARADDIQPVLESVAVLRGALGYRPM